MEPNYSFIIYAAVFRIAIILSGIISIVLGYKLFSKRIYTEVKDSKTEANISSGPLKIYLKNGGPGLFFAMFGVCIICIMLINGIPVSIEEVDGNRIKRTIRGNSAIKDEMTIEELNDEGVKFERKGELDKAYDYYSKAVKLTSIPINNFAWILQKQGNYTDSIALSRVTVFMDPNNPKYIDTLAVALCKNGMLEESLEVINKIKVKTKEINKRKKKINSGICE
jgi:tetratricopeptide (TPR) repeat protein